MKNLKHQLAEAQGQSNQPKKPKQTESQGRPSALRVRLPQPLIGKAALTADGKRLCFNYNISGCPEAGHGGKCAKGYHLCMEPTGPGGTACAKPHPCNGHS